MVILSEWKRNHFLGQKDCSYIYYFFLNFQEFSFLFSHFHLMISHVSLMSENLDIQKNVLTWKKEFRILLSLKKWSWVWWSSRSEGSLEFHFLTDLHLGKTIILTKSVLGMSKSSKEERLVVSGGPLSWERGWAIKLSEWPIKATCQKWNN